MMNLYRNFGSMLENWVADGYPEASCVAEEALEKQHDGGISSDSASADSLRLTAIAQRSESEDSGVDLSHVGSPKASRSSCEDPLTLKQDAVSETEKDLQGSPSSPASSVCSSSSSSSCFSAALRTLSVTDGRPHVDQDLRRNEREASEKESHFQEKGLDAGPRGRCNTTNGLYSATARTPHRTGSLGSRRPLSQPADQHRPAQPPPEAKCEGDPEWDGLSPGLLYLERMCRMLEEIARLQRQNRSLQEKVDIIHTNRETVSHQKKGITSTAKEKPEVLHPEDQSSLYSHSFRRRTASDTWAFLRHRRKQVPLSDQLKSTDILLEEPDGSLELPVETHQKKASTLKQKISSLRKNEKVKQSRNGSFSSERSVLRLFRNRRQSTKL